MLSEINIGKEKKHKPKFKIYNTLIIATVIFIAVLLFFVVWKCFFDDSLIGTWTTSYTITSTDEKTQKETSVTENYSFTFYDDLTVDYHYGGMTLKGRYCFLNSDTPQIEVIITNAGSTYIDARFDYSFSGNIFTGRTLSLVDRSGVLFIPESADSKDSNINNKSTVIDNTKYYICDFKNIGYSDDIHYYDNFQEDDKLTCSWLYQYNDYKNTYSFEKDGTFEMLVIDEADVKGAYTIQDGKLKFRYYYISSVAYPNEAEFEYEYKIDKDKLTLTSDNISIELTKTDSKYYK